MNESIGRTWRALRDRFAAAGIASAALDARLLVRHALGLDETRLIASENEIFPAPAAASLERFVQRRLEGEPVARILGAQEFYGLSFGLNAHTLIPRPETEMLVNFGLARLARHPAPRILDLGTGSGCIILALLHALPDALGVGVDISHEALEQARANAAALSLSARLETRRGHWFGPVEGESFDLIVSNPPYIAHRVIETLALEVRRFDPPAALDGGEDGLDPYRIIARHARAHLESDGLLALETGYDQGHMVYALLQEAGFIDISVARDLAGQDRMVTARTPR